MPGSSLRVRPEPQPAKCVSSARRAWSFASQSSSVVGRDPIRRSTSEEGKPEVLHP